MSTHTRPGGFVGDPAEAFTPPAASGCCGGPSTSADTTAGSGGCCGSTAEATPREAVDAGAGCCG